MTQYAAPARAFTTPQQLVVYTFGQDAVAASQTDANLPRSMSEASQVVATSICPWAGEVVGIGITLSAAATAGELTVGVTKNGTESAATTQTITTETEMSAAFLRTTLPVAVGDNIGAQISTDASWDGTTADMVVDVYVLYHVTGV